MYLLNSCPTKAVQEKICSEAWSGWKPQQNIAKFLVAFAMHVRKEKISKLNEKTKKEIFLGYSTQSKGYQVYNLKKLIINQDLMFDGDTSKNWETNQLEIVKS